MWHVETGKEKWLGPGWGLCSALFSSKYSALASCIHVALCFTPTQRAMSMNGMRMPFKGWILRNCFVDQLKNAVIGFYRYKSTCASRLLFLIWQFLLWISTGCFFLRTMKWLTGTHKENFIPQLGGREGKLFCLGSYFSLTPGWFGVHIINCRARTECQAPFPTL